jgi:hypothetical protein
MVQTALGDRGLLRHLAYLAELDAEAARYRALPAAFRASALGARVLADDAMARSYAVDGVAQLARARYTRMLDELRELSNQGTAVRIEVLNAQRGELDLRAHGGAPRPGATPTDPPAYAVDTVEDGQRWPFTGEVWRDEVGTYRVPIASRCGR